jgi:hypothetical protein
MPIEFSGGPLNGQGMMSEEEMAGMPPEMSAPPLGAGAESAVEEAPDEGAMFKSLLDNIRGLLSLGTLSEQNKLNLEKASTLVQQIKASEEKDEESAMGGKMTPGVMRKLGGYY